MIPQHPKAITLAAILPQNKMKQILIFQYLIFTSLFILGQKIVNAQNKTIIGTTIIISMLNDKIIIAADSKQTGIGQGRYDLEIPPKCKICHIKDFFFAAAGNTEMVSPHIDFLSILENLKIDTIRSFHDKVVYSIEMLKKSVNSFVQNFNKFNPLLFDSLLKKPPLMQIVFAAFENKKPVSEVVNWEVRLTSNGWEVVSTLMICNSIPRYLILGHGEAIDSLMNGDSKIANNLDEKTLNFLIESQVKSTPIIVGPPIDMVVIKSDGFKWIQKKQKCN